MPLQPPLVSGVFTLRRKSPGDTSDWLGHVTTLGARNSLPGSSAKPSGMGEKLLSKKGGAEGMSG